MLNALAKSKNIEQIINFSHQPQLAHQQPDSQLVQSYFFL